MSLLRPDALPLLLLAPLAAFGLWALDRARARRLALAVGPRALADLSAGRRRLRRALFVTAFLLALLAMLEPAWGAASGFDQRGIDIVVCLDVSRSMLARDVAPSRLARARLEIRALAGRAAGDRLGLVVFAGDARLAVPLTRDLDSLAELVGLADPLSVERGGSDLGAALTTALGALAGRTGVVLLLTDGEDLEGRGLRAAQTCRERGIAVHCVGFGSARGAKIPIEGAFLKDRSGAEVVSAMDPARLRRIAAATGGDFVDTPSLVELYEERVLPLARESVAGGERRERENRFQWPLLAAVFFWIFFQSEISDLSSRRMRSSDRSFAAVRQMTPPEPCGRTERTILRNLVRVSRDSILRLTPTLEAEGR